MCGTWHSSRCHTSIWGEIDGLPCPPSASQRIPKQAHILQSWLADDPGWGGCLKGNPPRDACTPETSNLALCRASKTWFLGCSSGNMDSSRETQRASLGVTLPASTAMFTQSSRMVPGRAKKKKKTGSRKAPIQGSPDGLRCKFPDGKWARFGVNLRKLLALTVQQSSNLAV